METKDGKQAIYAKTRAEWRRWLKKNSQTEKSVWLILYHKNSAVKCINLNDATEEALCFGWIDSLAKKRDPESFYLTFTPRNAKSKWSAPNRERAGRMIEEGLMTEHGQKQIDLAIGSGRWEPDAKKPAKKRKSAPATKSKRKPATKTKRKNAD